MSRICRRRESSNQVVEEKRLEEGHINNCTLMIKKERDTTCSEGNAQEWAKWPLPGC